jgi:hypothetical protein
VWANFSDQATNLQLPHDHPADGARGPAGPLRSPPNSVGILHMRHENKTWSPLD